MCEFDISDTLSHISSLSSPRKNTESPKPKLKIKVGNIKEKQTYPLNKTLVGRGYGYPNTIGLLKSAHNYSSDDISKIDDFTVLRKMRDDKLGFVGNFIDDYALNRRYSTPVLGKRIDEYISNLEHDTGIAGGSTITAKRFNGVMLDGLNEMRYNPSDMPQATAKASLVSTALNEAVSIATKVGVSDSITGTRSLATNPTSESIQALDAIGETLNAAAEKIYGGPEMTSMAVQGVSDTKRALIANQTFEKFIQELEKSTATNDNSIMRDVLKNYRIIQKDELQRNEFKSTATSSVTKLND
jgi:hypothetical protein